jgi:hypothetical protein
VYHLSAVCISLYCVNGEENYLRIFERQILRKISGPVNIDNVWRIRNNMEIDNLIEGVDIVRLIKAQKSNGWGIAT